MSNYVRPPVWPPRPDLYDEVSWGDLPSSDDYSLAYRLWSLPNANLAPGRIIADDDDPPSVLVRNVYDHIAPDRSDEPPDKDDFEPDAQMNVDPDGSGAVQGWAYAQILPNAAPPPAPPGRADILVDGHGYQKEKPKDYWVKPRLLLALRARNLSTDGKVDVLRNRLFDEEVRRQGQQHSSDNLFPRADLEQWGIKRAGQFILEINRQKRLSPLDMYTWAIVLSPYNPTYWTSRAYLFYQLGHFDLALGDAYRAFYLVEILHNNLIRTKQPGLYRCILDAVEQHIVATGCARDEEPVATMRKANGINAFVPALRRTFHHIISLSLVALEAWEDLEEMEKHLTQRLIQTGNHKKPFADRAELMRSFLAARTAERKTDDNLWDHEKRMGSVAARPYPQAARDVDRTNPAFLTRLNESVVHGWPGAEEDGPLLVVQQAGPSSLSVNASVEIEEGTLIYADEPSVRGHLVSGRQAGTRCENCKRMVSDEKIDEIWQAFDNEATQKNQQSSCCPCCLLDEETGVPLFFCPPSQIANPPDAGAESRTCLEIARALFHNGVCGRRWLWLHQAMQPLAPTPQKPSVDHEKHGTIFSLLLREVFDMTLLARRQGTAPNILAHEIDAMLPLCGGEDLPSDPEQRFPFGYAANIVIPFDILLALGVNIFRDLDFDTWVFQTVLRKLQLNVVPWDHYRRGKSERGSTLGTENYDFFRAKFENMYIHTGFAMFNHACSGSANASWWWDGEEPGIPNRIMVRTNCLIAPGEEIRICYFPESNTSEEKKMRLFGRDCDCDQCLP